MSEQRYIYWHPGDEQPEDLSGWKYFNESFNQFIGREREDKPLKYNVYNKEVSDAEYRAHHGMKLWHGNYPDSKIQDGYKVIDFRRTAKGELFATHWGRACKSNGTMVSFVPVLEKIEPEIVWVTPTQQDVIDCIKATGDYPEAVFAANRDELSYENAYTRKLVYVGYMFIDSGCGCFNHCKMNAALREEWR